MSCGRLSTIDAKTIVVVAVVVVVIAAVVVAVVAVVDVDVFFLLLGVKSNPSLNFKAHKRFEIKNKKIEQVELFRLISFYLMYLPELFELCRNLL